MQFFRKLRIYPLIALFTLIFAACSGRKNPVESTISGAGEAVSEAVQDGMDTVSSVIEEGGEMFSDMTDGGMDSVSSKTESASGTGESDSRR